MYISQFRYRQIICSREFNFFVNLMWLASPSSCFCAIIFKLLKFCYQKRPLGYHSLLTNVHLQSHSYVKKQWWYSKTILRSQYYHCYPCSWRSDKVFVDEVDNYDHFYLVDMIELACMNVIFIITVLSAYSLWRCKSGPMRLNSVIIDMWRRF